MIAWEPLLDELIERLGDRLTPDWQEAFRAMPRHLFLPDKGLRAADAGGSTSRVDRTADPDAWWNAAYSDDAIVTQEDENSRSTSSCSMPYMVAGMLSHLDARAGEKVLEIGTGTGWNAALLASRLGDDSVYTIEVDPEVADFARANLARAGRTPSVVTGDGALGWEPAAPFDRIIATCTVNPVPWAWIAQTLRGGVILTPWSTPLGNGALLRLEVVEHGTAHGRFVDPASFMWLRDQLPSGPDEPHDFEQSAEITRAKVSLQELFEHDAKFAVGLLVKGCKETYDYTEDDYIRTVWLLSEDSWASADSDGVVRQLGPRRLWEEVETAYTWWEVSDRPEFRRFGVTVTRRGQTIWLDDPSAVLTRK